MSSETAANNRQMTEESEYCLVPNTLNDARHDEASFLPRKLEEDWDDHTCGKLMFLISKRLIQAVLHPLSKLSEFGGDTVQTGDLRVPMFFADARRIDLEDVAYFLGVVATLFGCIHLVPSFFLHYASPVEMWLWRISAAFITVQPLLGSGVGIFGGIFTDMIGEYLPYVIVNAVSTLFIASLPLYIVSRLALIVLAFLSLRDLPVSAHHTIDWISSIPHL